MSKNGKKDLRKVYDAGMKDLGKNVVHNHKKNNVPIVIMQNDKIVIIPADKADSLLGDV